MFFNRFCFYLTLGSDCESDISNCAVSSIYTKSIGKDSMTYRWSYLSDLSTSEHCCMECNVGYTLGSDKLTCSKDCTNTNCDSCESDNGYYVCQFCSVPLANDIDNNICLQDTPLITYDKCYEQVSKEHSILIRANFKIILGCWLRKLLLIC